MVVMKPFSMPTVWCSTLATGARQLVVQEAFETMTSSFVSILSFTPWTMVLSTPSAGAEISTRLAPARRCALAFSFVVKWPVHSSAISTPSSRCGSSAGFLMAVTRILWPSTSMVSPSTVTWPGKRPCTESYRSRWALVWRPQIVHRHHHKVVALRFHDGAQHQPADAAKSVDRDAKGHACLLIGRGGWTRRLPGFNAETARSVRNRAATRLSTTSRAALVRVLRSYRALASARAARQGRPALTGFAPAA